MKAELEVVKTQTKGRGLIPTYALKTDIGYVRRRWWGGTHFTQDKNKATKWTDNTKAVLWARSQGFKI